MKTKNAQFFQRPGKALLCCLLISTVVTACDDSQSSKTRQTLALVTAEGPFGAGTMMGTYMRADGETITTQVWFPTSDSMGETVKYEGILDGQSLFDAQPNCDEPRPVVVFSHGNGGVRWQSAFNMHFLATHGFVVVAMDHIYNTFRDLDREKFLEHVLQRPRDVRDTFDWLISKSLDPDHALSGCIQPDAGYAVMGHSFGGYTSFMSAGATVDTAVLATACDDGEEGACQLVENWAAQSDAPLIDVSDDRVWAAVTWSPWHAAGILSDGMADVRVPSLTITGTLDELTPLTQVKGLVDAATQADYVHLIDAGHFGFAPFSCMLLSGDGCGDGYMAIERLKDLTNQMVTSFLAAKLGWESAEEQYKAIDGDDIEWQSPR